MTKMFSLVMKCILASIIEYNCPRVYLFILHFTAGLFYLKGRVQLVYDTSDFKLDFDFL